MSTLGHLKYHFHVASKNRGVKNLKLWLIVCASHKLPSQQRSDLIYGECLSTPDPPALAHSAYQAILAQATGILRREALIGFLDRVLPKPACGIGRACLQAILVCTVVSRRHELKETSPGPMWIEGSLVPEKALDGPETYHLQHTSQGGFWLVTRVERSQAEVTDRAEKGH